MDEEKNVKGHAKFDWPGFFDDLIIVVMIIIIVAGSNILYSHFTTKSVIEKSYND